MAKFKWHRRTSLEISPEELAMLGATVEGGRTLGDVLLPKLTLMAVHGAAQAPLLASVKIPQSPELRVLLPDVKDAIAQTQKKELLK